MTVYGIVLFAALLHASWNAIVKGGSDKLLTTVLVAGSAALLAAVALPFLDQPAASSWPYIAASVLLQVVYYALLARAYQVADMSHAYPLMRGCAPLLVAVLGIYWLGEPLSGSAWLGIAIICGGILGMAGRGLAGSPGLGLALANAGVIAGYTLIDGVGVRLSGAPVAYGLWIFLLSGLALVAWALAQLQRRGALVRYLGGNWHYGLIGGFGTIASYSLALWAMTLAPVAVIAALRETSILFATAISGLILKERLSAVRIAAACVIALGAVTLRLP